MYKKTKEKTVYCEPVIFSSQKLVKNKCFFIVRVYGNSSWRLHVTARATKRF